MRLHARWYTIGHSHGFGPSAACFPGRGPTFGSDRDGAFLERKVKTCACEALFETEESEGFLMVLCKPC